MQSFNIDPTISLTVVVGLAAVVSPVLTTLLNNIHQIIMKKLEYKQLEYNRSILHKREIFENFLQALSIVAQNPSKENIELFAKYYPLTYIYVPKPVQKTLAEINLYLQHGYADEIVKYVDLISTDIHEELRQLYK